MWVREQATENSFRNKYLKCPKKLGPTNYHDIVEKENYEQELAIVWLQTTKLDSCQGH